MQKLSYSSYCRENGKELDFYGSKGPALLDAMGLAEYLGVGEGAVRNIMKRSDFPKVKIGTRYKAVVHLIDDWLEKNIGEDITEVI